VPVNKTRTPRCGIDQAVAHRQIDVADAGLFDAKVCRPVIWNRVSLAYWSRLVV